MRWIAWMSLLFVAPVHALCDRPPRVLSGQDCAATQHAIVFAAGAGRAAQVAAVIDEIAEPYLRHFGHALPTGVVLESAGPNPDPALVSELKANGARWVIVLEPRPDDPSAEIGPQLRQALQGRDEAQVESAMQQLQQQLAGAMAAGQDALPGLRHRVVHAAIQARYWPDVAPDPAAYGTPAPDWLDEAVLTLFDTPEAAQQRQRLLAETGGSAAGLTQLQARSHPAHTMLGQRRSAGVRIIRLESNDPQAAMKAHPAVEAARLQAQAASLAAFMTAESPRTFAAVYAALAKGERFETWLRREGPQHGLPTSESELDRAWQAWRAART